MLFLSDVSPDWIDIPITEYAYLLDTKEEEVKELEWIAIQYHELDFSSLENLEKKVELLRAMANNSCFQDVNHPLLQRIKGRIAYLEAISHLPNSMEWEEFHYDLAGKSDFSYEPLFLRNEGHFSPKMREYWGDFWIESIDPCHRRLGHYYQIFLQSGPPDNDPLSFFLWLESQHVPPYMPQVTYLSEKELSASVAIPDKGLLVSQELHTPITTSEKAYFVLDLTKTLRLVASRPGIWHTSLSHGKPVLGVGLIGLEGGRVKEISFMTGHYLPSLEQSYQIIRFLIEEDVSFVDPVEVTYFANRKRYRAVISNEVLYPFAKFQQAILSPECRQELSLYEF